MSCLCLCDVVTFGVAISQRSSSSQDVLGSVILPQCDPALIKRVSDEPPCYMLGLAFMSRDELGLGRIRGLWGLREIRRTVVEVK